MKGRGGEIWKTKSDHDVEMLADVGQYDAGI
jgi:hypothetical protein